MSGNQEPGAMPSFHISFTQSLQGSSVFLHMPIVCAVRRRILGDSSDTADIATVRFKNLLGAQTPRPRLVTLAPICPTHAHTGSQASVMQDF